jgi:hypothetical protein
MAARESDFESYSLTVAYMTLFSRDRPPRSKERIKNKNRNILSGTVRIKSIQHHGKEEASV